MLVSLVFRTMTPSCLARSCARRDLSHSLYIPILTPFPQARLAFDCLWIALRFAYGCSSRIVLASFVFLLPLVKATSKNFIPVVTHVVCMVSRSVVLPLAVKLATFLARTVIIWAATLLLDAISTTVWGLGSCACWIGELSWVHRVALVSTVIRLVWAGVAGIYQVSSPAFCLNVQQRCSTVRRSSAKKYTKHSAGCANIVPTIISLTPPYPPPPHLPPGPPPSPSARAIFKSQR